MVECREVDKGDSTVSITVVGASGDLAKKKIYPALFALYYENCLPKVCLTLNSMLSLFLWGSMRCSIEWRDVFFLLGQWVPYRWALQNLPNWKNLTHAIVHNFPLNLGCSLRLEIMPSRQLYGGNPLSHLLCKTSKGGPGLDIIVRKLYGNIIVILILYYSNQNWPDPDLEPEGKRGKGDVPGGRVSLIWPDPVWKSQCTTKHCCACTVGDHAPCQHTVPYCMMAKWLWENYHIRPLKTWWPTLFSNWFIWTSKQIMKQQSLDLI